MMKIISALIVLVAFSLGLSTYKGAYAQEAGVPNAASFPEIRKIAVMDMVRAEQSSQIWQDYLAQENQIKQSYQQEVRDLQIQFQQEGQALEAQKDLLAPEAFQQQRDAFNESVKAAQRESQNKKAALDLQLAKARKHIEEVMRQALIEAGNALELDIILNNHEGSVILAKDTLNITDDVIKRMNNIANRINIETLEKRLEPIN